MKLINWNQIAELGLLQRINSEILHPLGLAAARDPSTGHSIGALVSPDGEWKYRDDLKSKITSDDEVREKLQKMELIEVDEFGNVQGKS